MKTVICAKGSIPFIRKEKWNLPCWRKLENSLGQKRCSQCVYGLNKTYYESHTERCQAFNEHKKQIEVAAKKKKAYMNLKVKYPIM